MTISYNWLIDYLPDLEDEKIPTPQELSEILTDIGLEVEGLKKQEQIPGGLEGLVIGQIKEVEKHPNADRLKLTKVDVGDADYLQIVCGAPNVSLHQKVVVAPVGTTIYPLNGDPFKIKKAKIRKIASFGMMCAEDEIGLGEDHDGIMSLDGKAQPGMPAKEYFSLQEDWVYDIGLTPNRMDAMSHLGVAKDVCAKLSHNTQKKWRIQPASVENFEIDNTDKTVEVVIENQKSCPRYTGISIANIKIKESPEWMQERLRAVGVRPINNVVDTTNYVLHECGQPLHAFDLKAVTGNKVVVKNLPNDTTFVTLDKEKRKLRTEDLMICNAEEPMCIAGVFGGLHSGVTDETTSIFLESAYFDVVSVRRTSFHHALRTDAATHFEKGVDISGVIYALKRAALLIKELCDAEIVSALIDCYPQPKEKTKITLKKTYLSKLSGKEYDFNQVISILTNLGFELIEKTAEDITVAVPFNKPDMSVAADLVEEIMRIDGYSSVEIPTHIRIAPSSERAMETFEMPKEKIASYLTDNGFYEIMTNSITNSTYYKDKEGLVRLMNNLTVDLDILRPSLLETGLEAVAHNLNRKQENILFFENGTIYSTIGNKETPMLGMWISGAVRPGNWIQKSREADAFFLEGHLTNSFLRLGISSSSLSFLPQEESSFRNGMDILIGQKKIGQLGCVSKKKLASFDIKQEVWYAEVNILKLSKSLPKKGISFQPIPKYPEVRRDLALVLNKEIKFAEVEKVANDIKTRILEEIKLFDVFEGKKLGENKKSYAVSFLFRHPEKTLTDKEIDKVMKKMIRAFEQQLKAEIRS